MKWIKEEIYEADQVTLAGGEETILGVDHDGTLIWTIEGIAKWKPRAKCVGRLLENVVTIADYQLLQSDFRDYEFNRVVSSLEHDAISSQKSIERQQAKALLELMFGDAGKAINSLTTLKKRSQISVV